MRPHSLSSEVHDVLGAVGSPPLRTAYHSPWQNGVAERWVGTCRRETLDHVVVLNEDRLRRLLREFLSYYHDDRTHFALGKDPPLQRAVSPAPSSAAKVVSMPREPPGDAWRLG